MDGGISKKGYIVVSFCVYCDGAVLNEATIIIILVMYPGKINKST